MASRLIHGESLWTSAKLKKVPVQYRAEYANLLPLAEANGAFEYDPELIWSRVYAYNRTDVTPVIVTEILLEFEKAGMLTKYSAEDKVFGFWVGIEKEGRLPPPSQRVRYKNLPPPPPIKQKPEVAEEKFERPKSNLPLDTQLAAMCEETIGHVEDKKTYAKELKTAVKEFGHDYILDGFEQWAESVCPFSGRKPMTAFIKSLGNAPVAQKVSSPVLQKVETEIAAITDNQVFFHVNQKPLLASLIKEYSEAEVLEAFQDFWDALPDDQVQWAAKNFVEQCGLRIDAVRMKRHKQEQKDKLVESSLAAARQAVEDEIDEQEDVEDEL